MCAVDAGSSTLSADPVIDLLVYAELALACLVVLVIFRHGVAEPIGRLVLPVPPEGQTEAQRTAQVCKFGDSACECANYFLFTVIGCSVVLTSDWVWAPDGSWLQPLWWANEGDPATTLIRDDVRCWYILDASRYSATLFSILFLEHRRKDFSEMCVHHVATILVTLISYSLGFTRLGVRPQSNLPLLVI